MLCIHLTEILGVSSCQRCQPSRTGTVRMRLLRLCRRSCCGAVSLSRSKNRAGGLPGMACESTGRQVRKQEEALSFRAGRSHLTQPKIRNLVVSGVHDRGLEKYFLDSAESLKPEDSDWSQLFRWLYGRGNGSRDAAAAGTLDRDTSRPSLQRRSLSIRQAIKFLVNGHFPYCEWLNDDLAGLSARTLPT